MLEQLIYKFKKSETLLLCAIILKNPISEEILDKELSVIDEFEEYSVFDSVTSLEHKFFIQYSNNEYIINPYLQEVCYTFMRKKRSHEFARVEQIPFFKQNNLPNYDEIKQAHEKGDYPTFYRLLNKKRKEGRYEEVIEILHEVYWNDENKGAILNEIGLTYKWQKKIEEAKKYFKQGIEFKNIQSFTELSIIFKEQGKYDDATKILGESLLLQDDNPQTLNELGIIKRLQGKPIDAIKYFEKGIELNNIQSYTEISILYKEHEQYGNAINVLNSALVKEPKNVRILNELGIVYKLQKDYKNAIEVFKNLIDKFNHPPAYNELAIVYLKQERFDEALSIVEDGLVKQIYNDDYLLSTKKRIIQAKNKTNVHMNNNKVVKNTKKILFLAANPNDQSRIQSDKEHRKIKEEVAKGKYRDKFIFLPPQFAVTISELIKAMNEEPNIIHFSGHGEKEGLCITTDNNETQVLPIEALKRIFKNLNNITEIVLLNGCYTTEQAKIISSFGMFVVGINEEIDDEASISFAKGLYNGLGEGKIFEDAFNDAMIVLLTEFNDYANYFEVWKNSQKLNL